MGIHRLFPTPRTLVAAVAVWPRPSYAAHNTYRISARARRRDR